MSKPGMYVCSVLVASFTLFVSAPLKSSAQSQPRPATPDQPAHRKTPFYYQVDIGAVVPTGHTSSAGAYKSSFMIGGGFGLPVKKWLSLDLADMDFGFGTTNQTQTISVSNGTTATTKNYQMLFNSGPQFNIPLPHGAALGLGGGFAAAVQNEYVPDQYSTVGGVTVITSVHCTSCSHNSFNGSYAAARIFAQDGKFKNLGFGVKYYMLKDTQDDLSIHTGLPAQNWLTAGITFTFRI